MGIEIALGIAALAAGGLMGAQAISGNQEKQQAKKDAARAADLASQKDKGIGNLTKDEAATSASKKMFREGLYFTSPTGLSSGGTRGRSRLFGA